MSTIHFLCPKIAELVLFNLRKITFMQWQTAQWVEVSESYTDSKYHEKKLTIAVTYASVMRAGQLI